MRTVLLATLVVGACGGAPEEAGTPRDTGADQPPPGAVAVGTPLRAHVVENVTACEVDALCFLRLSLGEDTVIALYGTGERPAPPCPVSAEVSGVAFGLRTGDAVEVVLFDCGPDGYFIEALRRAPG